MSTLPAESDAERIARRYPKPRASMPVLVAVGVLMVALVGYVVWVAAHRANPPVSARIEAFRVVSDVETTATVVVDRPDPTRPVRCLVFVQAVSYERVGEKFVDVAPSADRLTTVPVSVRTYKRGTAVTVEDCLPTG